MPKWFSYLAMLVVVLAVGGGACGGLTYYAFGEWRKASQWQDAFDEAKRKGDKELGEFFFGSPDPTKRSAKLDAALKPEFEAAAKKGDAELKRFLGTHVLPNGFIPWACLLGIFGVGYLLAYPCRPLFLKHNGRMMFIITLNGLMGGYFAFLAINDIYPMGIDLAGGTELIYRLDFKAVDRRIEATQKQLDEKLEQQRVDHNVSEDVIRRLRSDLQALTDSKRTAPDKATEVVRKRVDPTGVKGIPVTGYDENKRIRIQLPKANPEEVERIKRAIRTQGRLTFNLVARQDTDREIITKVMDPKNLLHEYGGYEQMFIEKKDTYDPKVIHKEPVVVEKIPRLEGSRVVFAGASRSMEGGWEVNLRFDAAGSSLFEEMTAANVGRRMAIILDGICHSAPVIKERIGGDCRISGSFTQKEASELSSILQAGSLPADVVPESEFTVGPALGNEQIQSGLNATVVAAVFVALFMWFYYRLGGFVTILTMAVNLTVMLGALGFFKATMTLPGIAGIALTFGMAVDANVLVFERIREEQARGRPLRLAVQAGFERAFSAIIDSNLTTLLSGLILYYIGSGPVRGFAVTLSIGILVTLYANVWVFRQIMEWLVAKEAVPELKMRQLLPETHIDFMAMRKPWYFISGGLVLASLIGFFLVGVVKDSIYDLDFTGGTLVQFNFAKGKEQKDADVKRLTDETYQARVKERLTAIVGKLRELEGSTQQGDDLKRTIYAELPEVARSHLAATSAPSKESLEDIALGVQKVLDEFDKLRLTVQSFGSPNGEQGYRSFTMTTRVTDVVVIETLIGQLKLLYAGELEPTAVEVVGEAIRVQFERKEKDPPEGVEAAVVFSEADAAVKRLIEGKEYLAIHEPLKVLKVGEPVAAGAPGRFYLDLSPVPEDPITRELVRASVEETTIPHQAAGPIGRKSSFGGQVAGEMRLTAVLALLGSLVAMWIYLWFRFEFSAAWGFGAIVALFHDATVSVGAVCLVSTLGILPILVDLNLVAAVLTIIGFSVNDTIVIFDRIREVKSAHPTRALTEIINESVNATLSRTILTTGTALLATLALCLLGGPTIRDLTFTLLVGMIAGVYSTVFIASPLMMWWYQRFGATFTTYPMQSGAQESAPSGAQI